MQFKLWRRGLEKPICHAERSEVSILRLASSRIDSSFPRMTNSIPRIALLILQQKWVYMVYTFYG